MERHEPCKYLIFVTAKLSNYYTSGIKIIEIEIFQKKEKVYFDKGLMCFNLCNACLNWDSIFRIRK